MHIASLAMSVHRLIKDVLKHDRSCRLSLKSKWKEPWLSCVFSEDFLNIQQVSFPIVDCCHGNVLGGYCKLGLSLDLVANHDSHCQLVRLKSNWKTVFQLLHMFQMGCYANKTKKKTNFVNVLFTKYDQLPLVYGHT